MKKVLEGYLFCKPYIGDAWILLKDGGLAKEYREINGKMSDKITIRELDRMCEIELRAEFLDSALSDFEGKKVRITIEEVKEDTRRKVG